MEMVPCEEDLPLRKVKLSLSEMEMLFTWFLSVNHLQTRNYTQCTRQVVSASVLPPMPSCSHIRHHLYQLSTATVFFDVAFPACFRKNSATPKGPESASI